MADAYVLAGELLASEGDHVAAFHGYQRRMMPFLPSKQASAARFALTLTPRTAIGIAARNAVTESPRISWTLERPLSGTQPASATVRSRQILLNNSRRFKRTQKTVRFQRNFALMPAEIALSWLISRTSD
jgi:hypothetical protein